MHIGGGMFCARKGVKRRDAAGIGSIQKITERAKDDVQPSMTATKPVSFGGCRFEEGVLKEKCV